ncbi:hypothetical protein BFW01_g1801 [Lasiodiplodia theobromae]|uniref:NAD(P)-binding domain-containing protein n=1 Tax=Lasiodiplodia theobromae TaxID=45133 RepID=A0A8H7ISJ7_9PEZI|nr:hypothetical protein BFW01_g1801 [Lasiodiplodia theobromae]
MTSFQKVVLVGKGLLGSAVLEQLAKDQFTVTVLSRNASSVHDIPSGVKVHQVDYSSQESLVEALTGQDVVVNTVGMSGLLGQKTIIDASIKAGVKRYIPADWGSFTTDPNARALPILRPMVEIQDYLKDKAASGALEYTIFSVGAFLDFVLDSPLILDLKAHSIQVYDEGRHPFSSTSVSGVGRAVSGALKAREATKNRNIFIHEAVLTQAKLFQWAKKYSPPGTQWTETKLDAQQELDRSLQDLEKDPGNIGHTFPILKACLLGGKYRSAYPKVDNEIVGLPLLTDKELEARFASKVQGATVAE